MRNNSFGMYYLVQHAPELAVAVRDGVRKLDEASARPVKKNQNIQVGPARSLGQRLPRIEGGWVKVGQNHGPHECVESQCAKIMQTV